MDLFLRHKNTYVTGAIIALTLAGVSVLSYRFSVADHKVAERPATQQQSADQQDRSLPASFQPGLITARSNTTEALRYLDRKHPAGELVYETTLRTDKEGLHPLQALVLQHFDTQHNAICTYPITANTRPFFSPQFSPDGHYVLLKSGETADRHDTYEILLWNLKTNRIEAGPAYRIAFPQVRWSPDSKALAFVVDGDSEGWQIGGRPVPSLHIYHLDTAESTLILQSRTAIDFAWTKQRTLLYTTFGDSLVADDNGGFDVRIQDNPFDDNDTGDAPVTHPVYPAIYEALELGGYGKLIIPYAFHALPSPNGRWIAFDGWNKVDSEFKRRSLAQTNTWLYVYDRIAHRRALLTKQLFDGAIWTPDSKHLIGMTTHFGKEGEGTAVITEWSVPTGWKMADAFARAHHTVAVIRSRASPEFELDQMAEDGSRLYVRVLESGPKFPGLNASPILYSWQEVNLSTGMVRPIFRFEECSGYDWHPQPTTH